jgi:hypothetical protein
MHPRRLIFFLPFVMRVEGVGLGFLDLDVPLMFQMIPSDILQNGLDGITFKPISFSQKLNLPNLGNWISIWNFVLACSHCLVFFYVLVHCCLYLLFCRNQCGVVMVDQVKGILKLYL